MKTPATPLLISFVLAVFGGLFWFTPTHGGLLYKNYTVKYDQGQDILCEPYIVKKDDYIHKVFKNKGEIAYRDFHEFLAIFKRINPQIEDVNHIRSGQYILIPLQKIALESLPGQSSGTVTIPFVTLSNPSDIDGKQPTAYIVREGDCVSVLVHRELRKYGRAAYRRGLVQFKQLNPGISDMNRIFVGQKVYLPTSQMIGTMQGLAIAPEKDSPSADGSENDTGWPTPEATVKRKAQSTSMLKQVAAALDAKLLDRGDYFFPSQMGEDKKLNLSRSPVMVFKNRTRILFRPENDENTLDPEIVKSYWKNLHVVGLSLRSTAESVLGTVMKRLNIQKERKTVRFTDGEVSVAVGGDWIIHNSFTGEDQGRSICVALIGTSGERTPSPIIRYLDQHGIVLGEVLRGKESAIAPPPFRLPETARRVITVKGASQREFMENFMAALDYPYTPNVSITFPYAGIQVKAVSNLISTRDGAPVFVDFGDLYGDAIDAIRKAGFNVVRIPPGENPFDAAVRILETAGIAHTENPVLLAAKRAAESNTSLTLPGVLIENPEKPKMLMTRAPLPPELIFFLFEREIKVLKIGT